MEALKKSDLDIHGTDRNSVLGQKLDKRSSKQSNKADDESLSLRTTTIMTKMDDAGDGGCDKDSHGTLL